MLFGRGVQAPSLIDSNLQFNRQGGPVNISAAGSPDLNASTTTNYELDYDRILPALQSTLRSAVYYGVNRDLLAAALNTSIFLFKGFKSSYLQNIGSDTAVGGEIGLSGSNPAGLRWNLSYFLASVHQRLSYAQPLIPFNFNNATPVSAIAFGACYS